MTKLNFIFISLFLIVNSFDSSAQVNKKALLELLKKEQVRTQKQESRIKQYLKLNPDLNRSFKIKDQEMSIIDVEDGYPVYYATFNEGSAQSIGVSSLRRDGGLGLDLTGKGLRIGVWDRQRPIPTHVEFEDRLQDGDFLIEFSEHSTHVTGTLIAAGINPDARGMCSDADGIAYDWFEDTEEMIIESLNKDLSLSNHSYGVPGGWNSGVWLGNQDVSTEEDYRFGFYDNDAKAFDDISYNAPYYSIVVAAGNERGGSGNGSFPADGPYDCITGFSNSKNVFTVGAVQKLTGSYSQPSDVSMSSFSSWGPTDDGRIKPDLVAPGVSILSAVETSDQAYGQLNGTSMASPATAGSIGLINQAGEIFVGNRLKSATLKALMVNTAHEAGPSLGPDYMFGWGLVNAEGAVQFLMNNDNVNNILSESRLLQNEQKEIILNPQPNTDIKITLAWTDPSGTVLTRQLDPRDRMLVNDLDITLTDEDNVTHRSWALDVEDPEAAAVQSGNSVDNVEKIDVSNTKDQLYTLQISHKGNLENLGQDYSLIISYISKSTQSTNLYWVEGDGNSSDNKWSDVSGGAILGSNSTLNSRIIFDDNSSQNELNFVLSSAIEANSLVVNRSGTTTLDLNGNVLKINGNISAGSSGLTIKNGTIILSNTDSQFKNYLDLNETELENVDIAFDDNNVSTYVVSGNSFNLQNFTVQGGGIEFINSELQFNSLNILEGAEGGLLLENTSLAIKDRISFENGVVSEVIGNSLISIDDTNCSININSARFDSPISIFNSSVDFEGSSNFLNLLAQNSDLFIDNNLTFEKIQIAGNSSLELSSNVNAEFIEWLISNNTNEINIFSQSSTDKPTISVDPSMKYCFDNLNIENVDLAQNGVVSVGSNSTINNSDNWFLGECNDIILPGFNSQFLCARALSKFTESSDGNVSERKWFVEGERVFGDEIMEFYFEEAGEYEVALEVSNSSGFKTVKTEMVTIMPSNLQENTIFDNGTQLTSIGIFNSYQWYNYGAPIPGATERTYNYNGAPGIYWVVAFEGSCNLRSEIVDLGTNIEEIDDTKIIITPNPVNDFLLMKVQDSSMEINRATIVNALGKVMRDVTAGTMDGQINVKDLPSGMYSIYIYSGTKAFTKKIIKL